MLAYLFWHWREAQIEAQTYQEHLNSFPSDALCTQAKRISFFTSIVVGADSLDGEKRENV